MFQAMRMSRCYREVDLACLAPTLGACENIGQSSQLGTHYVHHGGVPRAQCYLYRRRATAPERDSSRCSRGTARREGRPWR
ncbi:hypothetical protein GCM10012319_74010 [Comamonas sp. KCTC 72670]|nr:hypothetical protein GCM10012319_74010 [Comamonas sp. KCTC 72670]